MRKCRFLLIVTVLLIVTGNGPAALCATSATVAVLQESVEEIVLEFSAPGYTLIPAPVIPYQSIVIAGCGTMETAGAPAVAMRGALIEIPEGCALELSARSLEKTALRNVLLSPSPRKTVEEDESGAQTVREEYLADAALYATDAFFPGKLAEAGVSGYLRDKHVVSVMFYPVQYNPVSRQLELHKKIRVSLKIKPAAAMDGKTAVMAQPALPGLPAEEEKSFSSIYSSCLLNYKPGLETTTPAARQNKSLAVQSLERDQSPFAIKARVTEEGIYKITYEDLSALGVDLSSATNENLKVENQGAEAAAYRSGSGLFKAGDYILFYGIPFKSLYTKQNVYWVYQGSGSGKRMASIEGSPVNSYTALQSFHNSIHAEEDKDYRQTIPGGDGVDHWFWKRLQPTSEAVPARADFPLTLQNFSTTSGNFSMRVKFWAETKLNHHTKVHLNGTMVADFTWSGSIELTQDIAGISPLLFQEGANTITIEEWLPSGQSGDRILVNWIEADYVDTYVAESDVLKFKGEGTGGSGFQVTNFSTATIRVFDVTDPVNVSHIQNPAITASGSSNQLNFEDSLSGTKTYYALTAAKFKSPAGMVVDTLSSLKTPRAAVDYIIITHESFYADIQRLKDYRAGQGLGVEVVKIQDIYDEFSYGLKDARAIKDFLTYAYNHWKAGGHPTYVLLVGDASIDYRDDYGNAAQGYVDYVPTYLFQTDALGDTPTDNWFVCVNGTDYLPEMIIGRLCVRPGTGAADDTANIIDKITAYESASAGDWSKHVIFAADAYNAFELTSDALVSLLPGAFTPEKVYLSTYANAAAATTDLVNKINSGSLITMYTGHGSIDNWSGSYLFHTPEDASGNTRNDVDRLNNGGSKLTFVLTLDCLNGLFPNFTDRYSLAEEIVRARDKGAIACLAGTGLGFNSAHQVLAEKIINRLFNEGDTIAGSAVYTAKLAAYAQIHSRDIVETFTFLGDPATVLKTADFFTTSSTSVGASSTTTIGVSSTTTAGVSSTTTTGVSSTTTIGVSSTTTIGVSSTTTIGVSSTTTIGVSSTTTIGVSSTTTIGVSSTTTIGVSSTTTSVPDTTSTITIPEVFSVSPQPLAMSLYKGKTGQKALMLSNRTDSALDFEIAYPALVTLTTDPAGDVITGGSTAPIVDITRVDAGFNWSMQWMRLQITFAGPVVPELLGYIYLDTDQNPATGKPKLTQEYGAGVLGYEFRLNFMLAGSQGLVIVEDANGKKPPLSLLGFYRQGNTVFTVDVPLSAINKNNGTINLGMQLGNKAFKMDVAPDAAPAVLAGQGTFIPWLTIEQTAGSLAAREIQPLTLTFDSRRIPEGTYTDHLTISGTAGSLVTEVAVPITLTVFNDATRVITGSVYGAVRNGVTVKLYQGSRCLEELKQTTVTDGDGNYGFYNLPDGTYTVSAEKQGYTMTPEYYYQTIPRDNQDALDFQAQ